MNATCNLGSDRSSSSGGLGAIHYAAQYGNHKIISILLDAGANPNLIKNNGCTALHTTVFAAGYDQFRKGRSIDVYLKCIDILMEHAKFELPRHDRHDDDKIAVSFGIPTFEYVSIFFRTDMHNCLSSSLLSLFFYPSHYFFILGLR